MAKKQREMISKWLVSSWPMLLALALGVYFFLINILGPDFAYFPGDLGDARLNIYFLEHAYRFFTGQVDSFWNAPFMYPTADVMSYSDTLLGSAPIFALFRLLGCDVYTSFQWWYAVLVILNFSAAYLFLNYVFKNRYAAALGAFVFAFSIGIHSQGYHAQTFARFAIPIALLMAVKFKESLHPKYFFLTVLAVVYQIYCGVYLGFMLVVPTGIFLLLGVLKGWRDGNNALKRGKWYALIGASLVANLLVLWPLMQPYTKRAIHSSYEHYQQIVHTIPTIKSYFYSTRGSVVWEFFSDMNVQIQMWGQHQLFSGGVATVCLFLGFVWVVATLFRSNWRVISLSTTQMLLITGLITFILFLRIDRVSAYLALYYIPGFSSLRSLTRIINIQLLFFAISVSFVFAAILKKSGKRNTVVFLLALGVLVLDNSFDGNGIFRKSKSEARERVSVLDDALSRIPDGSVFSYEPTNPDDLPIHYQLDAMLASQKHNLKTVNGYTATSPVEFSFYWHGPNAPNRNYWLSKQNLEFDSLFVVESPDSTHTVTPSEIQSSMSDKVQYEFGVRQMIRVIKSDSGWMESIRKKAEKQKIPLDSMIVLDAIWMVKNNE